MTGRVIILSIASAPRPLARRGCMKSSTMAFWVIAQPRQRAMANDIEDLSGLLQSFGPAVFAILVFPVLVTTRNGTWALASSLLSFLRLVQAFCCPCFCSQRSRHPDWLWKASLRVEDGSH